MNITIREQMVTNLIAIKRDLYGIRQLVKVYPESMQAGIIARIGEAYEACDQLQGALERIG